MIWKLQESTQRGQSYQHAGTDRELRWQTYPRLAHEHYFVKDKHVSGTKVIAEVKGHSRGQRSQ